MGLSMWNGYYLGSRRAGREILLMWDMKVVERIEECVLEVSMIILSGLLAGVMVLMVTMARNCFRTNWRGLLAGGRCRGVLGVILTSSASPAKDLSVSIRP